MKQSSYSPWKILSNSIISAKNSLWNLVMGGYIKVSDQTDAINSGNYSVQMKSGVSDGATAVGFQLDTNTALANETSKIASIKSGGVEHFMLGAGKASFGVGNTVTQGYAFGDTNTANGAYSFVVGTGSSAVSYGIALGFGSVVSDANGSLAIGGAIASGYASNAIGPDNQSRGFYALTMGGYSNYNDGYVSNLIGIQNTADPTSQFCNLLGNTNIAIGSEASLIGSGNTADSSLGGVALGSSNIVSGSNSTAIGFGNVADNNYNTTIGYKANAGGQYGTAVGAFVSANGGLYSTIVGGSSFGNNTLHLSKTYGTAIGFGDSYAAFYTEKGQYSSIETPRLGIASVDSVGTEILTNSGMTSDTGWTKGTGWTWSASGFSHAAGTASSLTQSISGLTIGTTYVLHYVLGDLSAGRITPSFTTSGVELNNRDFRVGYTINTSPNGIKVLFTATTTTEVISFAALSSTVCTIRSVSLKKSTSGDLSVGGTIYNNGGVVGEYNYRAITALRTLDSTDELVDCTANTFTVTLPTAVGYKKKYIVKNSGTGIITLATTSSQTIDGVASGIITLVKNDSIVLRSNGANWMIDGTNFLTPHVSALDTTTQAIAVANTPQVITFDTLVVNAKFTATSSSRFTVKEGGNYMVAFTAHVTASAANKTLDIWFRVNGNDIANSNNKTLVVNNEVKIVSGTSIISMNAGDYGEIWMSGDATTLSIISYPAGVTPTRPATPSIKMTVDRLP